MNIAFVFRHNGYFRYFNNVIGILCKRGHDVTVLSRQQFKAQDIARPIKLFQEQLPDCEFQYLAPQRGLRWRINSIIRQIIDYAFYFKSDHPSPLSVKRWEPFLFPPIRLGVKNRFFKKILISDAVQRIFQKLETISPPEPRAIDWLKENAPDIVVGSPGVFASTLDLEFLKAAQSLQIPTVIAVASWDNLTTKGTFHLSPDHVIVWNQPLLEEAVRLHNIPKEKVIITGAPSFDSWFDMNPVSDRNSFCQQVGIDSHKPYIVYLGSSRPIAGDESQFVCEFVSELMENEQTKDITVLVRPHPTNAEFWNDFSVKNAIIWPKGGDLPDIPQSLQSYYDTLYHSIAAVGINTSAFLEAAIVGKPCLTILNDYYRHSQSGLGHFQHLVDGDFIEISSSFSEAAERLAKIKLGIDRMKENRKNFVKEFVRPIGIDQSPSQKMAEEIESILNNR